MDTKVIVQCISCEHGHTIELNMEDYRSWKGGERIQDAMPYLSAAERELLMSRICPVCWDEMFNYNE